MHTIHYSAIRNTTLYHQVRITLVHPHKSRAKKRKQAHALVALCHSPNYNFKGEAYYQASFPPKNQHLKDRDTDEGEKKQQQQQHLNSYTHSLSKIDEYARFLESATYGITQAELDSFDVSNVDVDTQIINWMKEQMNETLILPTSHREFWRKRVNGGRVRQVIVFFRSYQKNFMECFVSLEINNVCLYKLFTFVCYFMNVVTYTVIICDSKSPM